MLAWSCPAAAHGRRHPRIVVDPSRPRLAGGMTDGAKQRLSEAALSQSSPPVSETPHASGASRDISRAVGLISGMVLLSRLLGFVRDAIIAAPFGQNAITSAYLYAFTLPDTLWMLVAGGAFYAAFVPVITEYFTHGDEDAAWKTYSIIT